MHIILSIHNKDESTFTKYEDIDKVAHLAVDDFVREKRKRNDFEVKKSLDYLGNILGSNTLVLMKPQIEDKVKEKIHDYFASNEGSDNEIVNALVHGFNRLTLKMKFNSSIGEFKGVKYMNRGDRLSELGIGFTPEYSSEEIVARIQLIKKKDIWIVDRLPNITEIIDALEKSQKD